MIGGVYTGYSSDKINIVYSQVFDYFSREYLKVQFVLVLTSEEFYSYDSHQFTGFEGSVEYIRSSLYTEIPTQLSDLTFVAGETVGVRDDDPELELLRSPSESESQSYSTSVSESESVSQSTSMSMSDSDSMSLSTSMSNSDSMSASESISRSESESRSHSASNPPRPTLEIEASFEFNNEGAPNPQTVGQDSVELLQQIIAACIQPSIDTITQNDIRISSILLPKPTATITFIISVPDDYVLEKLTTYQGNNPFWDENNLIQVRNFVRLIITNNLNNNLVNEFEQFITNNVDYNGGLKFANFGPSDDANVNVEAPIEKFASDSQSHSESISQSESVSDSESLSQSTSESESRSLSASTSQSDSESLSASASQSHSVSVSESASQSNSTSVSESQSESNSESLSGSQSLSESNSDSASQSLSGSNSDSTSESVSASESESRSTSLSQSHSFPSESDSNSASFSVPLDWQNVTPQQLEYVLMESFTSGTWGDDNLQFSNASADLLKWIK